MKKRGSVSSKVSFVLLIVIIVVLSATGILINMNMKRMTIESIEREVGSESRAIAGKVDNFFEDKGKIIDQVTSNQTVLHYLDTAETREEALTNIYYEDMIQSLEGLKDQNPDVAMLWVASEKGNFLTGTGDVLSEEDFDLAERPWHKPVSETEGVYFTDPYMDQVFGKVIMSVMKVVEVNGESVGIVAADLFLDSIPSIMEEYKVGETGYNFLLAPDGNVIYHPNDELVMSEPLTSSAGDLGSIANKMVAGEEGLERAKFGEEFYYVGYEPVESANWSVATVVTQDEVFAPLKELTIELIIFFAIAAIVLVALVYFLIKYMLGNLAVMSEVIRNVATGDLTDRLDIKSNDELGQVSSDLNSMLDSLNEFVRIVQDNANQVAASSEELTVSTNETSLAAQEVARTIDTVSSGALQQINRTKEATERVVNMSDIFSSISQNAEKVANNSEVATQKAKHGEESVISATTQMDTIRETVQVAAETIIKLGERSNEIDQIVNTISDISDQTNLLALNASIEAARAGEHGQGFNVVANEVRKLAEQSRVAAGQIGTLINDIQLDTNLAVESVQDGTKEIERGSEELAKTGSTFNEITTIVSSVYEQIKDISLSIQGLSSETKQTVEIIQEVDKLAYIARESFENVAATTEEQTATLEEIAAVSYDSSSRAIELEEAVSKFKI